MNYKVELTEQAEREANEAYDWIAEQSPPNAINWFNGLVDAVETLQSFPERCPVAPESEDVGREIRHLIYGKYRILFAIEITTVFVLHVRHGAQKYLTKDDF